MIPDFNKDSEQTIRDKLQSIREFLATRTNTNMSRLQYDAQGNPIDRSLLTQMLSQQAPTVTSGDPTIQQVSGKSLKAPPGAKPGQRKRNPQDGKIYVVQPDLTMKPE